MMAMHKTRTTGEQQYHYSVDCVRASEDMGRAYTEWDADNERMGKDENDDKNTQHNRLKIFIMSYSLAS